MKGLENVLSRVTSFLLVISLFLISNQDKCQGQQSFGHEQNNVEIKPRESGLAGFEHIGRQYDVGPGGDLSYTIPLLSLPGRIPLDLNLTYTSGIEVDQSATWVNMP